MQYEAKILLPGDRFRELERGLDLGDGEAREVWLWDTPSLAFAAAGVVLRTRIGKRLETTVKLRGDLPAGLGARFASAGSAFKLERDCEGPTSWVDAASLSEKFRRDEDEPPTHAFSLRQLALVAERGVALPWAEIVDRGAIVATRWDADGVDVERWEIGDESVVELSLKSEDPLEGYRILRARLEGCGLGAERPLPSGKTAWALARLTSR